jgi:hypothetical protein
MIDVEIRQDGVHALVPEAHMHPSARKLRDTYACPPGNHMLGEIGWCEAALDPAFEVKVLEDRGEYEVEQDYAGRHVLYFKGRRNGFMPEYLDHPVKDLRTWQEHVKWRLDPTTPARWAGLDERMQFARAEAAQGKIICQNVSG